MCLRRKKKIKKNKNIWSVLRILRFRDNVIDKAKRERVRPTLFERHRNRTTMDVFKTKKKIKK